MTFKLIISKLSKNDLNDINVIILDGYTNEILNNHNTQCKIINPPVLDYHERYKIYHYLNTLSEKIILELKEHLNILNNVNFDTKDWKIIVGPWLNNFLKIIYNRYAKIKYVLDNNQISEISITTCDKICLSGIDNYHLISLTNNSEWNSIIYSKVIDFLKPKVKIVTKNLTSDFTRNKNKSFKSEIKKLLFFFTSLFVKQDNALIVNSYLPTFEYIKLNLYLRQFPLYWNPITLIKNKYDFELRNKIILKRSEDKFETFVKKLIPIYLPSCHLESFIDLKKIINNMRLPKTPKFIFTSNSYEFDELFKLYTVLKKKLKSKYIIGQHGNYLASLENIFFRDSYSADHYIDWGKNGLGLGQNGFNLKLVNKNIKNNKKGKILILDAPYGTNNKVQNRMDENIPRENFLHDLLNSIDKRLHKHIVIKLHFTYIERDKSYISKIRAICPDIKIKFSNKAIFKLLKQSRCIIHTYDSTGILESMVLDIPTFCFWPNKLNHIQKKYHKYYNELLNSDILFYEPKHLATKINKFFDDFDRWWLQNDTIDAVNNFLHQFSNKPNKNSTKVLAERLKEISKL